jgi:hypothetical protein
MADINQAFERVSASHPTPRMVTKIRPRVLPPPFKYHEQYVMDVINVRKTGYPHVNTDQVKYLYQVMHRF